MISNMMPETKCDTRRQTNDRSRVNLDKRN